MGGVLTGHYGIYMRILDGSNTLHLPQDVGDSNQNGFYFVMYIAGLPR